MKTVFKYPLRMNQINTLKLPSGAKILAVGAQGYDLFLWAEVDTDETTKSEVKIAIVGTGHQVPDRSKHLGTVFMGEFVWHIYEVKDEL